MNFAPLLASALRAGWSGTNYRGRPISRLEGPAFTGLALAGAVAAGAPPAPVICAGTGALIAGRIDDVWGNGAARGLRGHFAALRRGRVSTGTAKVVLLAATGALTAIGARRTYRSNAPVASPGAPVDIVDTVDTVDTATIAGCVALGANLANLFDLRPGRALKVVLAVSLPVTGTDSAGGSVLAGVASAAIACLPAELAERSMLGDAGANPAGALTGLGLALTAGPRGRRLLLAAMLALTLASEAVSFSQVIAAAAPLRRLDDLGRRGPT